MSSHGGIRIVGGEEVFLNAPIYPCRSPAKRASERANSSGEGAPASSLGGIRIVGGQKVFLNAPRYPSGSPAKPTSKGASKGASTSASTSAFTSASTSASTSGQVSKASSRGGTRIVGGKQVFLNAAERLCTTPTQDPHKPHTEDRVHKISWLGWLARDVWSCCQAPVSSHQTQS